MHQNFDNTTFLWEYKFHIMHQYIHTSDLLHPLVLYFLLEMGQYWLQEYQCIMSKISQYSDASRLKSIRSFSFSYNHWVTGNDKIISLSIDPKLLPYCTRVSPLQKCHFKPFIHYSKYLIDRYTTIPWYLICSIDTHNEMKHNTSRCINTSQYHLYFLYYVSMWIL